MDSTTKLFLQDILKYLPENIVKADQVPTDGWRIILFSTNNHQFVQIIILEFWISHDDATASVAGNAKKRTFWKKLLRNMEQRDKLMADLEEGHTALLSESLKSLKCPS